MEAIGTDSKDRPNTEIKLVSAHIFVDAIADKREELIDAKKEKNKAEKEKEKGKVSTISK